MYTIWNSFSDVYVVLFEDLHVCLRLAYLHVVAAVASAILYTRPIKYYVLLSVLTALGPIQPRNER